MTHKERRKNNPLHKLIKLDKVDMYLLKKHSFSISPDGYPVCSYKNKCTQIHRLILLDKEGYYIDHINRNRLDNRRCNLRYATPSQNQMNKKIPKNNTSGYRGVSFYKPNKKWRAKIKIDEKHIHIGYFESILDATKAYNKVAKELFGEFAVLNKV